MDNKNIMVASLTKFSKNTWHILYIKTKEGTISSHNAFRTHNQTEHKFHITFTA